MVEGIVGRSFALRACSRAATLLTMESHRRFYTHLCPLHLLSRSLVVRLNMQGIAKVVDCVLMPTVYLLQLQ